jgi:ribosomal protein L36
MTEYICPECKKTDKECDCIASICTDCQKEFKVSQDEKKWFEMKDYKLPKRCKPCRIIRRRNNKSVIENKNANKTVL